MQRRLFKMAAENPVCQVVGMGREIILTYTAPRRQAGSMVSFLNLSEPNINDRGWEGIRVGEFLKQVAAKTAATERTMELEDQWMAKKTPALYDFLCCKIGPDGKPRQTSSLTVFAREGYFHATLRDKGMKRTWWADGSTFLDSIFNLEAEISGIERTEETRHEEDPNAANGYAAEEGAAQPDSSGQKPSQAGRHRRTS